MRLRWLCAIAGCVLARAAHAGPSELVVVAADDPAFRRALGDALAPANMTLVPVADRAPSVVELSIVSRQVADREHATSAVWLVVEATKTTLVAYDRDVDRVLVREVPFAGGLDAEHAAEVARMARAMLHTLRVSPELDRPPPPVVEARAVRAAITLAMPEPRAEQLAIAAAAAVRVGAAGSDAGLAATLSVSWRPDALGADLDVAWSPHASIANAGFTGTFTDDLVALGVHAPLVTGPRLVVRGHAGGALHRLVLDGMLGGEPATETRLDPAGRLGVTAAYQLAPRVDLGVVMSADFLLRRQSYEAASREVLTVPRIQLATGLVVAVRIL